MPNQRLALCVDEHAAVDIAFDLIDERVDLVHRRDSVAVGGTDQGDLALACFKRLNNDWGC